MPKPAVPEKETVPSSAPTQLNSADRHRTAIKSQNSVPDFPRLPAARLPARPDCLPISPVEKKARPFAWASFSLPLGFIVKPLSPRDDVCGAGAGSKVDGQRSTLDVILGILDLEQVAQIVLQGSARRDPEACALAE